MNWRRLYATLQICAVVGGLAVGAAIFWAMIVTGIFRIAFGLGENTAMLFVFIPLFFCAVLFFVKALPKLLRKKGMLSDDPAKFGPWFKD
jgi:hypothetical protein